MLEAVYRSIEVEKKFSIAFFMKTYLIRDYRI